MTEGTTGALENKAAAPAAFDERFHEFMHGFEAFKRENDARLDEIEKRGSADVVTEEKVARINTALDGMKSMLDRMSLERSRPQLEGGRPVVDDEYKAAFSAYVKRGEEKALSISGAGEGGVLIPSEIESEILTRLGEVSPIRGIATVRQVSTGLYRKPVALGGFATG